MTFLFVDYNQGAGGELFCANLSQSENCIPLQYIKYNNGRTKVIDIFNQEFLKPEPEIIVKKSQSKLYDIVPTHQHTNLAKEKLENVCSIRIANPLDNKMWQFIKNQHINKVLLSKEPTGFYFLGMLKILVKSSGRNDWIKQVNPNMDVLTLTLISQSIAPTEENKNIYIKKLINTPPLLEPNIDFDLIIPYEDLIYKSKTIAEQIEQIFCIKITGNWLDTFKINYEAYLSKT